MSLQKTTKTGTNLYEIEFLVERADFDAAVEKVYRKNVKSISVPGFRKGKAPRSIIEKMYGVGVFYEEAINDCLPAAYSEAAKESALQIISQPEFDVSTIDEKGVLIKAKVYVKPEVQIKDYFGIPVEKTTAPVTDADVEAVINTTRERNARVIDVTDRPAQIGDTAVIDYEGFCDGVPFDGGKDQGHHLKLGSGQFIPGFEEQIVGKSIGESFDVNVTFPAEYHAENLAGKAAVFKVTLHGLKISELPALDDEFAKDVSEFDTLAEYKADVAAKLKEKNEKDAEAKVEEQLIDALIERLEAEIPAPMFDAETENFVRDFDNRLRMQGLNLSAYFKYTGLNLDALREQFRPQAERQVKTRLALEKIAELEGIAVSDEEIEEEYARIAKMYSMEVEQIKNSVEAEDLAADLKVKKAVDLVKEKAAVTVKTAEPAEAPEAEA